MEGEKLLYVDALNLFNFVARDGQRWSLLEGARKKIERFCKCAEASGWKVKCFIDAGTGDSGASNEAMEKWKARRLDNVAKGKRAVPQGSNVLLGDVFRSLGCEVFYSVKFDNDDTIAFMAQRDGAGVLSTDFDFYRYKDRRFAVYYDFETRGRKLHLFKRKTDEEAPRKGVEMRDLEPISDVDCRRIDPGIVSLKNNLYVRGCPCPLVSLLGNAHGAVRPLRQALYAQLGKKSVREIFPTWSAEKSQAIWIDEVVYAAANDVLFSQDPNVLVDQFFGKEKRPENVRDGDWYNHRFACHAIVWELWLIGQNPRKDPNELLRVMERFENENSREGKFYTRSTVSQETNTRSNPVAFSKLNKVETSSGESVRIPPVVAQTVTGKNLEALGFVFRSFPKGKGFYHCTLCGGEKGPIFTSEESCKKHWQQKHSKL